MSEAFPRFFYILLTLNSLFYCYFCYSSSAAECTRDVTEASPAAVIQALECEQQHTR